MLRLLACLVLVCVGPAAGDPLSPSLRGTVLDEDGEPLAGASVFVRTARPKEGEAILCPSCYLDCGRRAETGADGAFAIEDVDPELLFTLTGVAEGFTPFVTGFRDPLGEAVEMRLERRPELVDEPGRVFRGRVVDLEDNPVGAALVSVRMYSWGQIEGTRTTGSSRLEGADAMVMTRPDGTFELGFPRPLEELELHLSAKGFAEQQTTGVAVVGERTELTLGPGAIVRGRLVDGAGEPVAGRAVGLCGANRLGHAFIGEWTIATDEHGWFVFTNIPPSGVKRNLGDRWSYLGDGSEVEAYVYTMLADATAGGGSIEVAKIDVPRHGETRDLGTLSLSGDSVRLRGRVRLADGGGIPAGARLMVSRQHAWDQLIIPLDETGGAFDVRGLWPDEPAGLSFRVPGYRLSVENPNYHDGWQKLLGLPDPDSGELIVLLEPGEPESGRSETDWKLQGKRLRGIGTGDSPGPHAGSE
jgi:hypothetical protein